MRTILPAAALLSAAIASPALAQDQDGALAAEVAAMRAKIEALEAKVKELQGGPKAETPSWKGAPQFTDKKSGWSFKPRGRLQFDVGNVESPEGVQDRGLGFASEVRRARLGVEGTIPGGFGYKFEADFADNDIEVADALLSYDAAKGLGLVVGQHNNFQSLEEVTSSRFLSFMERAAFTDAFGFERRLGLSATFSQGDVLASFGAFTDNVGDLADDENNARSFDGRLVYLPRLGETQLHFGGSAHFRDNNDIAGAARYRQRPFVHTTDTRFLATPSLRVEKETSYGLEFAAIRGPFHATGEAHWLRPSLLSGGDTPSFFGGYAEVGYYLTGETRGYKAGQFDRTKVRKPVGEGGLGAVQVNLRYDHLDLSSGAIRGGIQNGYAASLVWIPQDYVRFLLNYARLGYDDAAIAASGGDRNYAIDVWGARAQVDF
ncbi:MAG TPA: porin [Allosphingosinicella sp.]|nr:porin [Allosphingosinicella sp.]